MFRREHFSEAVRDNPLAPYDWMYCTEANVNRFEQWVSASYARRGWFEKNGDGFAFGVGFFSLVFVIAPFMSQEGTVGAMAIAVVVGLVARSWARAYAKSDPNVGGFRLKHSMSYADEAALFVYFCQCYRHSCYPDAKAAEQYFSNLPPPR